MFLHFPLLLGRTRLYSFDACTVSAVIATRHYLNITPRLKASLPAALHQLAQEKGTSTWLAALSVEEFYCTLHNRTFHDVQILIICTVQTGR